MATPDTGTPPAARARIGAYVAWTFFAGAALVFVIYSVVVVLRCAPHALYADQWRQYLDYVTLPFPQNILHADNGHRIVVPNFIAWIENAWFGGNQWLQIIVGLGCGLLAAGIAAWLSARDRAIAAPYRAAAVFLAFFSIFWLANVRTLFHATELLHTKLPMACLLGAIALGIAAAQGRRTWPALAGALLLALAATFSFGYGLSVFLGLIATLLACKAERRVLLACGAALCVAALLYLALPGSEGARGSLTFVPLQNLLVGARWLGAPFVTMVPYLFDPQASGLVPTDLLSDAAHRVAVFDAAHLPDMRVSVLPQAAFGLAGMAALLLASWRRWRAPEPAGPMRALGLGIAWFGLGAAGIVSLSRLAYFQVHPEQIYADRYLCWPCLFWLGLALVALGSAARPRADGVRTPWPARATLVVAAVLPFVAWPTQYGGRLYAQFVQSHVENMAMATLVGVFPRAGGTGETDAQEMLRGRPAIAAKQLAQFGDPLAALPGAALPAGARVVDASVDLVPVDDNLFGDSGTAATVRLPAADAAPHHLLLIDADNRVAGLVVADARLDPPGYSGYARGVRAAGSLRVAEMP